MATLVLTDGTTTVDLLAGDLKLRHGGWSGLNSPTWVQQWTPVGYGGTQEFTRWERVTETFALTGTGTPDDLRAALVEIELLLEEARLSRDTLIGSYVYLRMTGDDEGSTRQALVYGGQANIVSRGTADPFQSDDRMEVVLSVFRHPLWEKYSVTRGDNETFGALGGTLVLTGDGTAPGRIGATAVYQNSAASPGPDRFWIGVREVLQGTDNFIPLWECEDGTPGTDAAATRTAADDASPADSGDNKVRVSYSTTTLAKRLSITVDDVYASNYLEACGRYLVLLRCKVSAGESDVQIRYGVNQWYDDSFVQGEPMLVDNTAWRLIPLGEVVIPATGVDSGNFSASDAQYTEIQIWAEEVSGSSTTLDLDTLTFIPSDHLLTFEGAKLAASLANVGLVNTLPDDRTVGYAYDPTGGARLPLVDVAVNDYYFPMNGGMVVAAAERAASSVLADEIKLQVTVYDRFTTVTDT